MSFPEFCRRYGTIEHLDVPQNTKEAVQQILMLQEVPSHAYKLGSSQVSRQLLQLVYMFVMRDEKEGRKK